MTAILARSLSASLPPALTTKVFVQSVLSFKQWYGQRAIHRPPVPDADQTIRNGPKRKLLLSGFAALVVRAVRTLSACGDDGAIEGGAPSRSAATPAWAAEPLAIATPHGSEAAPGGTPAHCHSSIDFYRCYPSVPRPFGTNKRMWPRADCKVILATRSAIIRNACAPTSSPDLSYNGSLVASMFRPI